MQAELNPNISQQSLSELMEAQQQSSKFWLKEMVENKVEFDKDKMFAALKEDAISSVKVAPLKPGDIISKDGKPMKVIRISSESGEPILVTCS